MIRQIIGWPAAKIRMAAVSLHVPFLVAVALALFPPWSNSMAGEIEFVLVAEGFELPSNFATPGGGDPRILVLERESGKVLTVLDGKVLPEPFLDISDRLHLSDEGTDGLVGIAFPPNFRDSKHVYVTYTPDSDSMVLSRFTLRDDTQSAIADSESVVLRIERFAVFHHCGHLVFGPLDGFLYMCVGDTDAQGNPKGTAQDLSTLHGSILRLDVESGADGYTVPPDNPFVSVEDARPEIWAYGLRNPWRFSIDSLSGDMFIPDVGWKAWEEINFQPAGSDSGRNYGWNLAQGNECRLECDEASITWPLIEFPHVGGICSIAGGMVYRGTEFPAWSGVYVFSDFCAGTIWALRDYGGKAQISELAEGYINPSAIGPGPAGEIMVVDYGGGALYRIVLPDFLAAEWQDVSTYMSRSILDARRKGNGELRRVFSSKTWLIAQKVKQVYQFLRLDRIYD